MITAVRAADLTGDADTDLADLVAFQTCHLGPGVPVGTCTCMVADRDCDGDVDLLDFRSFQIEFSGALSVPHLELEPHGLCIIPEERIPLEVFEVDGAGVRTLLDPSNVSLSLDGLSGSVSVEDGKPVVRVFTSGDVDHCGDLVATYAGLTVRGRIAAAEISEPDGGLVDAQNVAHNLRLGEYQQAKGQHDTAQSGFETEHDKLEHNQAGSLLHLEAFVFPTTHAEIAGGQSHPACLEIRRPLGPPPTPVACDQGFFEMVNLGGSELGLILESSNQVLNSSGGLVACPVQNAPLSDPNGCSRLYIYFAVQIRQLTEADVSEALVQQHEQVGQQSITAISASYIRGPAPGAAEVLYLVQPPHFCVAVASNSTTIASTPAACGGAITGITTAGIGSSNVFWVYQDYTLPRENWIMQMLRQVSITVSAPQYDDLSAAETLAMNKFFGLLKAELELAMRKQQALAQLEALGTQPGSGTRARTDYASEFVKPFVDDLADAGQSFVTDQIVDYIEDNVGLPISEVSETFDTLKDLHEQMKSAAELYSLLSSGDTNISDTDRIRKVKQAFDLVRSLGPGGPIVTALSPFLEFYSQALGAIADALDVIDEMRKEQVLSTGDCSIIEAIIADPQRRANWQRACQVRKLLQAVRDP